MSQRPNDLDGPPAAYVVVIKAQGPRQHELAIMIKTQRLPGGPYWLYRAYDPAFPDQPFLELISCPGVHDLEFALSTSRQWRLRKQTTAKPTSSMEIEEESI